MEPERPIYVGPPVALTKEDLRKLIDEAPVSPVIYWSPQETPMQVMSEASIKSIEHAARVLDLFLKYDEAETVVGDLLEGYNRRSHRPRHARRWIWFQTFWILLNRATNIVGRFRRAWAGK